MSEVGPRLPQQGGPDRAKIGTAIVVVVAVVGFGLYALISSNDRNSGTPMGSGTTCHDRLAAIVDEAYLIDHGLVIKDSDAATVAVGGTIAEVCMDGPSTLDVDDGAERVVDIVEQRYANG